MIRVRTFASCCVGFAWLATSAGASAQPQFPGPIEARLIRPQNIERALYGIAPLAWDPVLATAAAQHADYLARTRRWGHARAEQRRGQGENLWMGPRGYFAPEQMVGTWLSERRMFRPGIFPHVSATGNWQDVAHYSQIVWRGSTRIGCAIRSSRRDDYLVCRYAPAGNVMGRRPF